MAVNLNLVTFSGGTVIPKTDGIIYDSAIGKCGVFYGCRVTASDNTVYVSGGYGMIRGRFFEMQDSSVDVTLASSDAINGRIYLRLDLSNTTDPLQLLVASGSTLPDLTQEEDANFTNGVWEMELATFEISTSSVDNVVETYEAIVDNGSLISALQSAVDALNSKFASIPKILVERVGNIGSPYTYDLGQDGFNHGTYLVNVRRYGSASLDGTYWLGIISRLSTGNPVTNKWAINQIATNSSSEYTVSMNGSTLTITNSLSNNYAYLCITRLG